MQSRQILTRILYHPTCPPSKRYRLQLAAAIYEKNHSHASISSAPDGVIPLMDCINLYHDLLMTYQDDVYHSPIWPMNCTTKGTLVTSVTCILIVLYTNVNKFSLSTLWYKFLNWLLLPLNKMCLFISWRSNDKSTGLLAQRCTLIQVLPLHKVFCSLHICQNAISL